MGGGAAAAAVPMRHATRGCAWGSGAGRGPASCTVKRPGGVGHLASQPHPSVPQGTSTLPSHSAQPVHCSSSQRCTCSPASTRTHKPWPLFPLPTYATVRLLPKHTHPHPLAPARPPPTPHTYIPRNGIPAPQGGFQPEMTQREAALILGLRESAAEDRIKDAHRRIMVANHPDSGACRRPRRSRGRRRCWLPPAACRRWVVWFSRCAYGVGGRGAGAN